MGTGQEHGMSSPRQEWVGLNPMWSTAGVAVAWIQSVGCLDLFCRPYFAHPWFTGIQPAENFDLHS